jgi:short subunit dehydrogenase
LFWGLVRHLEFQKNCVEQVATLTGKNIIQLAALGAGTYALKTAFNRFFEYDLKDKTVLITGGSRGLGLVMAREFARAGSLLVLCARDEQEGQR